MKIAKIILFYFISFTWGIIMSLIGSVVCLGLIITGHKPKLFHHVVYFEVGENWGGVELGPFFLCCKGSGLHTKQHECGHGIQNTWFGPLMPFIVCLPSATRYWLREQPTQIRKQKFAKILFAIVAAFGLLLCLIPIFTQVYWLFILPVFVLVYDTIILLWLLLIEIPKYETKYPDYDSIWFEGQATKLGERYF